MKFFCKSTPRAREKLRKKTRICRMQAELFHVFSLLRKPHGPVLFASRRSTLFSAPSTSQFPNHGKIFLQIVPLSPQIVSVSPRCIRTHSNNLEVTGWLGKVWRWATAAPRNGKGSRIIKIWEKRAAATGRRVARPPALPWSWMFSTAPSAWILSGLQYFR